MLFIQQEKYQYLFHNNSIIVLDSPANLPDLTTMGNLCGIVQQHRRSENHYQSNQGYCNTSAVPHVDYLHVTARDAEMHAKVGPTNNQSIYMNMFSIGCLKGFSIFITCKA